MNRIFFLLIAAMSLFSKEKGDFLFYLHDAGETYALIPVIEKLEERGAKVLVLAAGVAEKAIPDAKRLGVEISSRSQRLTDEQLSQIVDEFEVEKVVTGVAYEAQGQFLEAYGKRGVLGIAYWDNFQADGENPYFKTARKVASVASLLLVPSEILKGEFATETEVVGQPTLEVWQSEIEAIDRLAVRKKLGVEEDQKLALFIGGYGPDYDEAYALFLRGMQTVPDIKFVVQPHPKTGIQSEITTIEGVAAADVVICHKSTVAFQSLAAGKPVVHVIPPSQTFDSLPIKMGLAEKVTQADEFPSVFLKEIPEFDFYELLQIPENSIERCATVISSSRISHLSHSETSR